MGAMQTVEALPSYDVVVLGAGYAGLMERCGSVGASFDCASRW